MRRFKTQNKKRCCALCKPYKRGHENRWKPKVFAKLEATDKEMKPYVPMGPTLHPIFPDGKPLF